LAAEIGDEGVDVWAEGTRIILPHEIQGARHVYNQFVVRTGRRDELRAFLAARGIASEVYYPEPMHRQPCFAPLGYRAGDFPQTERVATEALALPIYPELELALQDRVVSALISFSRGASGGSWPLPAEIRAAPSRGSGVVKRDS
jgi:dTDP-4-amino-4,6-dideoxygalactose transaminase